MCRVHAEVFSNDEHGAEMTLAAGVTFEKTAIKCGMCEHWEMICECLCMFVLMTPQKYHYSE